MTQYGLKAGLRKFGKKADKAAVKELTTLHVMNTWKPKHMHELSKEEQTNVLSSLIFIKEKWDGTVKGRACVDGLPQQKTTSKESAASPTVATESVFLTCLILAYERRHHRSYDVLSAFVNTNLDEEVNVVLRGDLAELH